MESPEISPIDIIQPQSNLEKVASFFQKGRVTKDLIIRLSKLDTTITSRDGSKRKEITMDDVRVYIKREADFNNTHYPPGYRYNAQIEQSRKRASMMEKMLKNENYKALIKPMLDSAVENWDFADRQDARVQKMSAEEKAQAEKLYNESLEQEAGISRRETETGKKQEHGIAPEFLEVGGNSRRQESNAFLAYATVLAKKVVGVEIVP